MSADDYDEWNDGVMDTVMRCFILILIIGLTLACGVAIQGRIDVGEHAGEPRQTPCPQGNP